ncbi:phage major capsid protein [Pedomonas mirosovicensis]|uniref:phage major capsid protein n=1 Tax=Pedomonas mirosovicensis TaxID=2908641 RepID=UPI0021675A22|nr:phage major capsid protein [Pedomonas mirosovicensis]MCH8683887.1 phage major capsid protein [Pedomonas mirosovicensis]
MDRFDLEVKLSTSEAGVLTGYASLFNDEPDSYGDVIAKGAFARSLAQHKAAGTVPLMLWHHDLAEPIGIWLDVREDSAGLVVTGRLILETRRGQEAYALLKAGALNGLSIGYRTRASDPRPGGGRILKDVDLYEISLVTIPAATRARITSVKNAAMGAAHERRNSMDRNEQNPAPEAGDTDIEERVTAIEESVAGIDTRLKAVEASITDVAKSASRIEQKLNRPGGIAPEVKSAPAELEGKAFGSFLRRGLERMDPLEAKALTVSADTAGGYLVPDQFQRELIKNLVLFSPMRQLARISQASSSSILLPKRTGTLTAKWEGETDDRDSTQPSYGQQTLTVYELGCYVDISNQLLEDSAFNMEAELSSDFAEEFGRAEGAAFINGTGAGQPSGLLNTAGITALEAAAANAITADELIDLFHALPGFYAANGTWIMNRSTIGVVRKLKNASGDYLWRDSLAEGNPPTILGRPVVEMPDMPDLGAGTVPVAFGDFRQGFRIFDRVSLSVLRDPYSIQTKGQVRFHARRRVAGGVVKAEAIKFLRMAAA